MQDLSKSLVVVKRSGQRVSFNELKIAIAIKYAFDAFPNKYDKSYANKVYEDVMSFIMENYKDRKTINVEDIQDIIEEQLKKAKFFDVYEEFNSYRNRRNESRRAFALKKQHKFVRVAQDLEDADTKFLSPAKALLKYGEIVSSSYTKSYVMDNKFIRAHDEGKIYIHDLDSFNLGFLEYINLRIDPLKLGKNYILDLYLSLTKASLETAQEILVNDIDNIFLSKAICFYKENFSIRLKQNLNMLGFLEFINIKKLDDTIAKITSFDTSISLFNEFLINDNIYNIFLKTLSLSKTEVLNDLYNNMEQLFNSINNTYFNYKYTFNLSFKDNNIILNYILKIIENNSYNNICFIFNVNNYLLNSYAMLERVATLIKINRNIKLNYSNNTLYFSNGICLESKNNMVLAVTSLNMARLGLKYRKLNKAFYSELLETLENIKCELDGVLETLGDKTKDNYKVLFNGNIYDDERLEKGQKIRKIIKNGILVINLSGFLEMIKFLDIEKDLVSQDRILKYIKTWIYKYTDSLKLDFKLSFAYFEDATNYFVNIDKTIYSNMLKDIDCYKNIVEFNNLKKLDSVSIYNKYLNGGYLISINIASDKDIINTIKSLNDLGFGLVTFKVGDST